MKINHLKNTQSFLTRRVKKYCEFAQLAMMSCMEYRFNFLIDIFLQPIVGVLVELTLWASIFTTSSSIQIGGFSIEYYLSYVIWAAFISRITMNWLYEFRMIEDIEKGTLNSILLRPLSFFETYLSQFIGYKALTTFFSLSIPILTVFLFGWPTYWVRLPLVLLLVFYYLVFVHIISFIISTISFHYTKVNSFSVGKNLLITVLSGEIVPMDLFPKDSVYPILVHLPFASGVYIPIGFLTGRISWDIFWLGFQSTTMGILTLSPIAYWLWKRGLKKYTGTGA